MRNDALAKSYMFKASKRLKILKVLFDEEDYSDVVREAQEIVELALKAMLRQVGIDPPKWHDVGKILLENHRLFPQELQSILPRLAGISKWLRKERELALYGDIDFIPTEEYGPEDAKRAMDDAGFCVEVALRFVE